MKVQGKLCGDAGSLDGLLPNPVEVAAAGDPAVGADEQPAGRSGLRIPVKVMFDVGTQRGR